MRAWDSSAAPRPWSASRHQLERFPGIAFDQVLDEPLLDLERDELLLGSVVDVPFEPSTFLVLRGHESLARSTELLDQPDVSEHETRLRREVADETLLRRVHRVTRWQHDRERAE